MKFKLSILCLLILFGTACSVKKRTYRNGYYVDWAFNKKQNTKESVIATNSNTNAIQKSEEVNTLRQESIKLLASNDALDLTNIYQKNKTGLLLLTDTCGDQIIFKSGDILAAKVLEITEDKIKYKRCDNIDGPLFVVSKSSVHSIKYVNGTSEIIVPPAYDPAVVSSNQKPEYKGPQKTNPKALLSVLAFLASFFTFGIGLIVSLLLAHKAIKEIHEEPKRWKGLALARFMKNLCIIILAIIAFIVVLLILAAI